MFYRIEREKEKFYIELQKSPEKIKTLKGLLPICASCKKIRDDRGYWHSVEAYVVSHSEADFTHSICPVFMDRLYSEYSEE